MRSVATELSAGKLKERDAMSTMLASSRSSRCHLICPHVTRRDIFFGVTVSPGFRDGPVARKISRRYASRDLASRSGCRAFVVTSPMPFVSGGMLLGQTMGASVAFARAWSAVRPHWAASSTIREAVIGPRDRLPGGIVAQLGPFLILLTIAVIVALNWDSGTRALSYALNLAGKADGWTAKFCRRRLSRARNRCRRVCDAAVHVLRGAELDTPASSDGP